MGFIPNLLLANKTIDIYRLNADKDAYEVVTTQVPMRYEGIEPVETALRVVDNIREQVMLITSNMMINPCDIEIADYIYVREDAKKFVVTGIQKHDELLISHFEILIRELDSKLHKTAKILRNTEQQDNYDPLLRTWVGEKNQEEIEASVLFTTEPLRNRGDTAVNTPGGMVEEGLFLFIIDLPTKVELTDRIEYAGEQYYVRRVEDLIFQYEVKAEKILPNGQQFNN